MILCFVFDLLAGEPLQGAPVYLMSVQHITFFPLLCIARFSWVLQSLIYVLAKPMDVRRCSCLLEALAGLWFLTYACGQAKWRAIEITTLALHYAYYIGIGQAFLQWNEALVFYVLCQVGSSRMSKCALTLALRSSVGLCWDWCSR